MKLVYKLVSILLIMLNTAGAWYGGLKLILDPLFLVISLLLILLGVLQAREKVHTV